MEWGSPKHFIWMWAAAAAIVIFALSHFRRRRQMSRFGDPDMIARLIVSLDPGLRLLKRILLVAAVFFMVIGLCQPHFKTREITVERKGTDVIIAIDVSHSMLAKDISPTRLDKAKLELESLIDRLKQDRVGIVAFAGEAFIQCPLTLDRSAVKLFLQTLNPDIIPTPGTMIGKALDVSLKAFMDKEKGNKTIILLTDGEDQGSEPLKAAKRVADEGIHVFTIGIGTADGSTLPGVSGAKRDRAGNTVISRLDEKLLKEIARLTGGKYYRSTRGDIESAAIEREIRLLGQKGLRSDKSIEYDENYQVFLVLALLCLLIELCIPERKEPKGAQ